MTARHARVTILCTVTAAIGFAAGYGLRPATPRDPRFLSFSSEAELRDALLGRGEDEVKTLLGEPDADFPASPDAPYTKGGTARVLGFRRRWRDPETGSDAPIIVHVHLDSAGRVRAVHLREMKPG